MLTTVTGAAGGERTGERERQAPVFFLHTVSTSTPSRRQGNALPARQAAGDCEAAVKSVVRRNRSGSQGVTVAGTMAGGGRGEYQAAQLLGGRKASGNDCADELDDDEEGEEEEYCWSSESDEDADGDEGGATMDAAMMETIRVDQRAQYAYPRRQRWADGSSNTNQRLVDYSDAETRSWDRTRAIGSGQRANGSTSLQDSILARISTLKALCDQGFISTDEYER